MSKRPVVDGPAAGDPAAGDAAPPEVIYIIRHAEKPADAPGGHGKHQNAPGGGVDFHGGQDEHCLSPRGWQRSGALAPLFAPAAGPPRAGLRTPGTLLSPSYGDPASTTAHRTCQTIQGLADRLGLPIATPFQVGHESHLAASVLRACSGVVLICWEHDHIPDLATAIPAVADTDIPGKWPGDRFDVIWAFTLEPGTASSRYAFSQIPQQLLSGDADTVIAG
jgi:hypothetical protein